MRSHARSAGAEPAGGWQLARQQTLLNGARQVQLLIHLLLLAFFLEQARVFENSGGLNGQRLQQLAIPAGEVGRRHARIHVEDAYGIGLRGQHACVFSHAGIDANQGNTHHAAQLQIGHTVLGPDFAGRLRIEVHGEHLAPLLQERDG